MGDSFVLKSLDTPLHKDKQLMRFGFWTLER